ncbi:hypothetical protein B7755_046595 [Streptomyces sp. NBS 14/10]|uniref:hypothetical protein n=1 Tax=Streptomyces sp. NBS 14/10 TaxID=1945643 RepID=UPI00211B1F96|nr:hypothetical protein [Streptomyces sp. NBS 14/10]KAK1184906.1 hypothetical protein B7755_046595 [Streptomyces sp. NBS 14/10]
MVSPIPVRRPLIILSGRRPGRRGGRIEALSSGVTTMLDWFHCSDRRENADAAIQALREAPGHSVFCYCAGAADEPYIAPEIRRVRAQLPDDGMVLGLRGPQLTTMDTTATDVALARELRLRVSVHVHGATGWLVAAARTRRCVTAGCSTTVRPSCTATASPTTRWR